SYRSGGISTSPSPRSCGRSPCNSYRSGTTSTSLSPTSYGQRRCSSYLSGPHSTNPSRMSRGRHPYGSCRSGTPLTSPSNKLCGQSLFKHSRSGAVPNLSSEETSRLRSECRKWREAWHHSCLGSVPKVVRRCTASLVYAKRLGGVA
ncbi:unnamed protein product, partial [Ectocarpus sp. 12 AP-2014]